MNSSQARLQIEHIGRNLADGQSAPREVCPFCNDPEKTFSVTARAGGLLYNCYRNTCRSSNRSAGFLRLGGAPDNLSSVLNTTPPKKLNPLDYALRELKLPEARALSAKYYLHITAEAGGVSGMRELRIVDEGPMKGRLALPVYGRLGGLLGWCLRKLPGAKDDGFPKSVAFVERADEPFMAWYSGEDVLRLTKLDEVPIAVVEDQISAMRVVQAISKCRAVALLGTHMDDGKALELAKNIPNTVAIALDRDAIGKSVELVARHSLLFKRLLSVPLSVDIKDLKTDAEVYEIFK